MACGEKERRSWILFFYFWSSSLCLASIPLAPPTAWKSGMAGRMEFQTDGQRDARGTPLSLSVRGLLSTSPSLCPAAGNDEQGGREEIRRTPGRPAHVAGKKAEVGIQDFVPTLVSPFHSSLPPCGFSRDRIPFPFTSLLCLYFSISLVPLSYLEFDWLDISLFTLGKEEIQGWRNGHRKGGGGCIRGDGRKRVTGKEQ